MGARVVTKAEQELAEGISLAIRLLHKKSRDLDDVVLDIRKVIGQQVLELRSQCPHPDWKYVPDASGNNDSYSYCTYCGKET